jgi:hypothetical protein
MLAAHRAASAIINPGDAANASLATAETHAVDNNTAVVPRGPVNFIVKSSEVFSGGGACCPRVRPGLAFAPGVVSIRSLPLSPQGAVGGLGACPRSTSF